MRYLFVAPRYHTNQVWNVRALKAAGHEVHYLSLYEGPTEDHTELRPTIAELSRIGRFLVAWAERRMDRMTAMRKYGVPHLRHMWSYLRKLEPDVIVIRDPMLPISVAAMLMGRMRRAGIILYTLGGMVLSPPYKERIKTILLWISRGAWITPLIRARDKGKTPHPRMFHVPFVAPEVGPPPQPTVEPPIRLLDIGKFVSRKNHLMLLDAAEPLLRAGRASLTIVGEAVTEEQKADLATVEQRVREANLGNAVAIRTNIPFSQISEVYRNADLFVLPAKDEPAGIVILEAMAHGLPVICSDTAGLQSYIEPGVNGSVFECGSVASLRQTLCDMTSDADRLSAMKAESYRLARTTYSRSAYVKRMDEICRVLKQACVR